MKIISSALLRRQPGEFGRFVASAFVLMSFATAGSAVAGPKTAYCNAIDDDDQRALCKALATKSGFFCSAIENENLRANCWSQASRAEAHCKVAIYETDYPVIDNVLMTQCKELSRKY
jgi:hypothetical protein